MIKPIELVFHVCESPGMVHFFWLTCLVQAETGVPLTQLHFTYGNRLMLDEARLAYYNIDPDGYHWYNSSIHLVQRSPFTIFAQRETGETITLQAALSDTVYMVRDQLEVR
jgi:hypothetical protein